MSFLLGKEAWKGHFDRKHVQKRHENRSVNQKKLEGWGQNVLPKKVEVPPVAGLISHLLGFTRLY